MVAVADGAALLTQPAAELRGPERLREVVRHRLSRLAADTAAAVELAAVAGPRFELQVLGAAAGLDADTLAGALAESIRSGLIEQLPEPVPTGRFTHELVRRVVYDRVPELRRAELHLAVGEALEQAYPARPARILPELAHHFTLAAPVAGTERAVDYNVRAGYAATAAAAFEEGAARLSSALELGIDDPHERARVQVELGFLLHQLGRGAEADARVSESLDVAGGLEERGIAARALMQRTFQRLADPGLDLDEMRLTCQAAIETLGLVGDLTGRAVAERLLSIALTRQGRAAEALEALERALVDAAGDQLTRREVIGTLANTLCVGPTPVSQGIRRCEVLLSTAGDDRVLEATIRRFLALLFAMAARHDEAREQIRRSSLVLDELNYLTPSWVYRAMSARAKELSGDRAGAEHDLKAAWQGFQELGDARIDERAINAATWLANLYCDDGRWEEAAECLAFGADVELAFPTPTALRRLGTRARLAAHRGELAEALELAQRAVEYAAPIDCLNAKADAWLALAEVQRANGAAAEAAAAVAEALQLYEAKGNVAAAANVDADRRLLCLDELHPPQVVGSVAHEQVHGRVRESRLRDELLRVFGVVGRAGHLRRGDELSSAHALRGVTDEQTHGRARVPRLGDQLPRMRWVVGRARNLRLLVPEGRSSRVLPGAWALTPRGRARPVDSGMGRGCRLGGRVWR